MKSTLTNDIPPPKCQNFLNMGHPLSAISSSPDGTKMIVAGREIVKIVSMENELKIINNLRAGKTQSLNYTGNDCCWHPSLIENYKFLIATAATNGAVVIWNTTREGSKSVERVLTDHSRAVNKLVWAPDKPDCLLTGSQDSTLRLWDFRDPNNSRIIFNPKSESIRDVQFNPFQPNQFAAAFDNGTVQIWDTRKQTSAVEKITAHQGLVLTLDWHPEEKNIIATGGRDRAIRIWDFTPSQVGGVMGKALHNISTISSVSRIKWRPSHKWQLASCSSIVDFQTHVWDVKRPFIPVASFTDHRDVPTGLLWRNPNALISCSKDGYLLINNINDAYKPYQHIRTTGISWNVNNDIASINDKINRNTSQYVSNTGIDHSTTSLTTQQQQFPSFFASFNVPTIPTPPQPTKVDQGVLYIHSPSNLPSTVNSIDKSYDYHVLFEYFAKNYKFQGLPFDQLCEHNEKVSIQAKQYHTSKIWALMNLYFTPLFNINNNNNNNNNNNTSTITNDESLDENNIIERLLLKEKKEKGQLNEIVQQQHHNHNEKKLKRNSSTHLHVDDIMNNNNNNHHHHHTSDIMVEQDGHLLLSDDMVVPNNANDEMTAKEPPSTSVYMESKNDQLLNNLLSAEAVTPLAPLPSRAPSIEIEKSKSPSSPNNTSPILINNDSNQDDSKMSKIDISSTTNNNNSSNNKEISKDNIQDNKINNNGQDNNNNNSNNSSKQDNNNTKQLQLQQQQQQQKESISSPSTPPQLQLEELFPPMEIEEFDFKPILTEMLEYCIERGDIQTCVFVILILKGTIQLNIESKRITQWFGSYIELLQRFKLWSNALEVMKNCDDQAINQASKRNTSLISSCSTCGKTIPNNGMVCEKCNRIAAICSICRLPVKGNYVWCQGCGHGGHADHMKKWFDSNQSACPTGCSHICKPSLKE